MFQLTVEEQRSLRRQFGTLKRGAHSKYQLLHRTASAIIEAERFNANHALMLVHSFSLANEWYGDFEFIKLKHRASRQFKIWRSQTAT